MPLVTCPTCSASISANAVACPKCGEPMKSSPAPAPAAVVIAPPPPQGPGRNCGHCGTFVPKRYNRCSQCDAYYGYRDHIDPPTRIFWSVILLGVCGWLGLEALPGYDTNGHPFLLVIGSIFGGILALNILHAIWHIVFVRRQWWHIDRA